MTSDPFPHPADDAVRSHIQYVGFWKRVCASLIDTVLASVLVASLSFLAFHQFAFDYSHEDNHPAHFILNSVIPAMIVLIFWVRLQTTPGKMLFHARIVDADTGADPTLGQFVLRYLGYFVSTVVFGLGFFWIAFDPRKQGWHDKIAGTVVVRDEAVGFRAKSAS